LVVGRIFLISIFDPDYCDIFWFPGYRAGSDGTIWSNCRREHLGESGWRKLKLSPLREYLRVGLTRDGKIYTRTVHSLVMQAFLGRRPEGFDVCHYDGNPHNNSLSNLRWGTDLDNAMDKRRHGTIWMGSMFRCAKLDEEKVADLKRKKEAGVPTKILAETFGVSRNTARQIMRGDKWAHVA
jgi:hypothetical protein